MAERTIPEGYQLAVETQDWVVEFEYGDTVRVKRTGDTGTVVFAFYKWPLIGYYCVTLEGGGYYVGRYDRLEVG